MDFIWILLLLIVIGVGLKMMQVCTMYRENCQEEEEVLVKPEVTINVISSIKSDKENSMDNKAYISIEKDEKERF